jgi:hypothetical protein
MHKLYEEYFRHKQIQEFIVFPAIMTVWNVYKKYYSKAAKYCIGRGKIRGKEKQMCFLKYKILSLKHAKKELLGYKSTCRRYSTNVSKCLKEVDNQLKKLDKEISKTEKQLAELTS